MKYKIKKDNYDLIKGKNLLHSLLKDRGVENPHELLNLDASVIHDGMLFNNMYEGLILLNNHIKKRNKIHIVIDSDFDGISSSAFIYNYLKDIDNGLEITYHQHKGKEHGIILKELESYDYDLLIVPDAGSDDKEACKTLKKKGKDILILDHHIFKNDIEDAVLINCQDGEYPNNTLSGVGVVYKFCKEYDLASNNNYADKYLDLVALGMVADDMDLRNYETRYLVLEGIKILNDNKKGNSFFNKLIENEVKDEKINITTIGWKLAPLINSVVRIGSMEEKEDVFKAIIGSDETREYQPRRKSKNDEKPPLEIQSLDVYMVRVIKNIKGRQDRLVKKGVESITNKIIDKEIDKNKIIIVEGTNELENTFTGLVANKLANYYKRPTLILREKSKDMFGGSGRNYGLFEIDNLMSFLNNTGMFTYIKGHENAFGVGIMKNKVQNAIKDINNKLKDVVIEDVHHVDYEIPIGRLREKDILEIGEWNDIWGNTLSEPIFAITDIYANIDDIQLLGSKKNIIKISKKIGSNNLNFIKFFSNEEEYNKMIMKSSKGLSKRDNKRFKLDIIGKFKINTYEGMKLPQIEIIDYNVSKVERPRF